MGEIAASKVTIAIPTMNRAEYLGLAVASALSQTYSNFEVVVSDNVSMDNTAEVLASFSSDPRLRVIRQPVRLSMVENWNACVAASTGKYFLLLSDDDLIDAEALSEMVSSFEGGLSPIEDIGIVYCRGRIINENGDVIRIGPSSPHVESAGEIIFEFFNGRRSTWACTILFRTNDIANGYMASLPLATDAAQWMQAVARHGYAIFVDRVLASYRLHQNISALTPVITWQRENLALAEYAIETLQSTGHAKTSTSSKIRQASQRLNVRIVPGLLNQRYGGKRSSTLRAYGVHWHEFASPYGLMWMARGLMQLLLPGVSSLLGHVRRFGRPDEVLRRP